MRNLLIIFSYSLIIFFFLTFFTGENNLAGDGKNELGFPLVFETESTNMINDNGNEVVFNSLYLLIDIVFAIIAGLLVWKLTMVIFKKIK